MNTASLCMMLVGITKPFSSYSLPTKMQECAQCFYHKQQFDLAKEQLEKSASEIEEMNDLKKEIYYVLGSILEQTGDIRGALEYYKEIYQVDIGYKDVAAKIERAYSKE